MRTKNKNHRRIAITLLLIFIPTILPVNALFAANNGPVSPEAASFEPVDAMDMVNLVTGDMSYVLPLLNVPSPEGGYPVALSYHAGIAMDQAASWTGLGWTVNPGAINRSVTGVPDDWKRSKINQIVYDAGGEITSYSGSVSVGWGNGMYSVGVYGSYTENKTYGGSTSYSSDGGVLGSVGPFGASLGTDGVSVGMFANYQAGSGGLSVSQSFKDGSTSVSLSYNAARGDSNVATSGVGISFNTRSGYSASVMGQGFRIGGNSATPGLLNVNSQVYAIPIQIYNVNITLGYRKARYWTYENNFTQYNGSLYAGDMDDFYDDTNFVNTVALDSYNSSYKLKSDEQLDKDNLSYIGYDYYSVSAQGLTGTIKPNILQQGSLLNNYKEGSQNNSTVSYKFGNSNLFTKTVDNSNDDIHFYMENDASSYLRVTSGNWNTSGVSTTPIQQQSPQGQALLSAINVDGDLHNGYNSVTKRKRTGTYIETFTNKEINQANSTNIIKPQNFNRATAPVDGVGAFRVTAVDGKVYHYSIPVYQKQQFTKSTDLNSDFSNRFFEQQQLEPYATHWLLTAITGPDYIDMNNNNMVDQADYGYWVEFDYGKWSDGYVWQTPLKSNDKVKSYEWGVKELYYLDKIKTRTHTALFIKEERQDDQSASFQIGNNANDLEWREKISRSFIEGKNGIWYFYGVYDHPNLNIYNLDMYDFLESEYGQYIKCNKQKSLKLSKILLLKNEDANVSKSNPQAPPPAFNGQIKLVQTFKVWRTTGQLRGQAQTEKNFVWNGALYNNIYDIQDIVGAGLEQKALRTIKFDYETSNLLAKGSPNSSAPGAGRLTLKAVNFIGKNNVQLIPPYKFSYDNTVSYSAAKEDNWGYYKNYPQAWSLNKITTPTGQELHIAYESDDVDKEATGGTRGFDAKLQFVFYQYNGKLRISIENEAGTGSTVNFTDFFELGYVPLDLWASYRHDYNDWGCKSRRGSVDVNTDVQVVGVSPTNVTLETSLGYCYNDNDGLNWLFGKVVGYDHHPGMIREPFKRGEWGNPPGCTGNPMDRLVLYYALEGNKTSLNPADKNGGGIRVKEISVKENTVTKNRILYYYNMPGYAATKTSPNYKSSGITSYIPQKYFKEIKYRTELPSPGVMYEYVTVKTMSGSGEPGSTEEYKFEVLRPDFHSAQSEYMDLGYSFDIQKNQSSVIPTATSNSETYKLNLSRYTVIDNTAALGSIMEKKTFNGKGQLMSSTQYGYNSLNDVAVGVSEESFNTYKRVNSNGTLNYLLSVTSKRKLPRVLEKVTTLQGGHKQIQYFDKYDFLTGQALETRNIASDGKSYKGRTIPAYLKYSEMGSKADNPGNKNMLSQAAVDYSYILDDATNTWKETGVGITTWSNIWNYKDITGETTSPANATQKVWRKHKIFVWNGVKDSNGIFLNYNNSAGQDDGFNWSLGVGSQPVQWKQLSENTLYDNYSNLLESKNVNNKASAVKMGYNGTKIVASGNAGFNEMFYTGAETFTNNYWLDSEVRLQNGARTNNSQFVHTGKYAVATTSASQLGVVLRAGQHTQGKYKLSVWVHKANVNQARVNVWNNATTVTQQFNGERYTAGNWVQLNHYLDVPVDEHYVYVNSADGSTVYYDDFRLCPVAASMTTYVYNEWDELTFIMGSNNMAVKYVYDAAGRTVEKFGEVVDDPDNGIPVGGFKKLESKQYYYRNL
jgi:hypothetical protein